VVSVPVAAVKLAEFEPAATEIDTGTVNAVGALFARLTAAAEGAFLDNVTLQEVDEFACRVVFAHCTEETDITETSENVTGCDIPFIEAVMVADWSDEIVPVDAVNVAVLEPDATETVAGIVNTDGAELASVTVAPAPDAALVNVTVHVVEALPESVVDPHCSEDKVAVVDSEIVTGLVTLL
jgi:hypothetical protein